MKKAEEGFDFYPVEPDNDDSHDMWSYYQKLCYSQVPPVPVITPMKALCDKDTYSANFKHYKIGKNIDLIVKVLMKLQGISELDLQDNNLNQTSVDSLVDYIAASQNLSTLNLSDNPKISTKGIVKILEKITTSPGIESLNISNTGCFSIGKQLAQVLTTCFILQKLSVSKCSLGTTALEFVKAIPSAQKLRNLDLSANGLYIGGKKFAVALGQSIGKSVSLKKIDLSRNSLTSEQTISLMRAISECPTLKSIDLHDNSIGDEAGRSISNFIVKSTSIKHIDISSNPILNVTINYINLKKKSMEEKDKPSSSKKDKKPKDPVPGALLILNGVAKSTSLIDIKMIGLVVKKEMWDQKLQATKEANPNCEIIYTSAMSARYDFGYVEPPPKEEKPEDPKGKQKPKPKSAK